MYTVRGDNGTGKSLMFANIKKKYGEQVFLFPVTSELYFRDSPNDGYSTGQKVMENLDFISNNNNLKNIRILLLDE
ncbi:hypothetical protein FACS189459_1600 [Bacilli bacterium]|nr:hypothetical protein FACS189459_1600 [Bacilli bacterium]